MKLIQMGILSPLAGVLAAFTLLGTAHAFEVSSPDLKAQGMKFSTEQTLDGFGCKGKNISPAVTWKDLPAGTQSLALMVHDADAPTGSGFWHWVVSNIPASANGLPAGAGTGQGTLPAGAVAGATDFLNTGTTGTGGYGLAHPRGMAYITTNSRCSRSKCPIFLRLPASRPRAQRH